MSAIFVQQEARCLAKLGYASPCLGYPRTDLGFFLIDVGDSKPGHALGDKTSLNENAR